MKIVMCPTFGEAHFIGLQIDNIFNTIDPDYLVYNEGAFPTGPEGKVSTEFLNAYTLDGHRGWDYDRLVDVINSARERWPTKQIILNNKNYTSNIPSECYYEGCSNFDELGIEVSKGDLIFPWEGDILHLHRDGKAIIESLENTRPGQGVKTQWIDFVGNQYYLQAKNISRRVGIVFDSLEGNFRNILLQFQSQNYHFLNTLHLNTFHYSWIRPGKYLDMRFAQIPRGGNRWDIMRAGINEIQKLGEQKAKVRIRPDNTPHMTFAEYINIEHPPEIKQHELYYAA